MGVVYKARQTRLNRLVALKMILAGSHAGEHDRRRFLREAEAVARLQHPNIVQIHEVGEANGHPFLSLEFCAGGCLADRLAGTQQPPGAAARLVEVLARAMQAAHEARVLHRDLKPANVLLTADGTPKIADFGLAKKIDGATGQTASGAILGTPSYMAPEQAAGKTKEVGPAADVYALGAILYECLTGRPPFKAATAFDTVLQVLSDEPVPPGRVRPGVPSDLETICLKCLQKEPGRRYSSATDLAEDLERWLADEPVQARPARAWERALAWVRRHPGPAVVSGLIMLVLLLSVLGSTMAWLWHHSEVARERAERALRLTEGVHPVLTAHLRVRRLAADGPNLRLIGDLGVNTYRARRIDRVEVEAVLSEPAYAYLISFNSTDQSQDRIQLIPQAEQHQPPSKRDRITPNIRLKLDDLEGLQALVVVASQQPLPAYTEWLKGRPALAWHHMPAVSGAVWRSNGKFTSRQSGDDPPLKGDAVRDWVEIDEAAIRDLARTLSEMPNIDAVEVVGFAVDR
jgi:hypothetical protein